MVGLLLTAACTSSPEPAASTSPAPASSVASPSALASETPAGPTPSAQQPSAQSPDSQTLKIDISIANGQVTPNGKKIDVEVGQTVLLNVTSDEDDEIHAHTGGDGYELEVPAGKATTGSFTLDSAGSFEVESHHLEKVIVILNAR